MLYEIHKEYERREHEFVRYADGVLILCRSRLSVEQKMNSDMETM